ncbi:MAG TPA: YdcF family protein [Mucilaginibacter sp.]|jgi:uncharacterized SAM-binding protein YcdF (DUF218 family)
MFFILSKLLIFFIDPFLWFLAFLILALIVKKPHLKRRFLIISAALLLIFSNPFLFNRFAGNWNIKPVPLKKTGQYSCAIVLGGFSGENASGGGSFNWSADRFIQGLKLLNTGKVSHILISSGNGSLTPDKFREADWAKTQLKLLKVPDSCILIEDNSRNTLENAAFSKSILKENHLAPPYILVTSAFHMRRSLGIFNKEKIDVVPYPCNYFAGNERISMMDFIPDAGVFGGWTLYIKELIGTIVNHFR